MKSNAWKKKHIYIRYTLRGRLLGYSLKMWTRVKSFYHRTKVIHVRTMDMNTVPHKRMNETFPLEQTHARARLRTLRTRFKRMKRFKDPRRKKSWEAFTKIITTHLFPWCSHPKRNNVSHLEYLKSITRVVREE